MRGTSREHDTGALSVITVDPRHDERWRRLTTRLPSTVFHSPAWMRVLSDTYGFALNARMLVTEDGEPAAGLPYAQIDDFLGPRIKLLPFSDFCDPLVADHAQWRLLVDGLVAQQRHIDLRWRGWNPAIDDDRFDVVHEALWHGIDIDRDVDEVWAGIKASARRAIRRARAAGVEVHRADSEQDLRKFYYLHLHVRKYKYDLLAQPYSFFRNIWREFLDHDDGRLLFATHEGSVVAGVVFLDWQDTMYYKYNASSFDHLSLRPNDLVLWQGITDARDKNLRMLDFGLSEPAQDGLVRYKRKYATDERTVCFARHVPAPTGGSGQQAREALRAMSALLVRPDVPDSVTEQAADLLYRYFA